MRGVVWKFPHEKLNAISLPQVPSIQAYNGCKGPHTTWFWLLLHSKIDLIISHANLIQSKLETLLRWDTRLWWRRQRRPWLCFQTVQAEDYFSLSNQRKNRIRSTDDIEGKMWSLRTPKSRTDWQVSLLFGRSLVSLVRSSNLESFDNSCLLKNLKLKSIKKRINLFTQ